MLCSNKLVCHRVCSLVCSLAPPPEEGSPPNKRRRWFSRRLWKAIPQAQVESNLADNRSKGCRELCAGQVNESAEEGLHLSLTQGLLILPVWEFGLLSFQQLASVPFSLVHSRAACFGVQSRTEQVPRQRRTGGRRGNHGLSGDWLRLR